MKKKEKKIKKESKQKKSFAQKITRINTTSSISYGEVETNPKDKRVKWIFGISLVALLATGIGVPIGLTGVQYVLEKPYSDNTEVLPDYTVGNITENLDNNSVQIDKNQQLIENIIVEKLYNEERDAFLKFKAFVDATKYKGTTDKVGPTSFGVDVSKQFNEIKQEQQKKLDIARKAMRESDPKTWESKWLNELKTNEIYGQASNEQEALDFMTKEIAKTAAFARFNTAEITTDKWTKHDLKLQAQEDIKYKDNKGKEQIINAGTQLFSEDLDQNTPPKIKNFLSNGGDNIAVPPTDSTEPWNKIKIAVYETKSYVLAERNPINRLPEMYNNYFKSANISSLSIPITINSEDNNFLWTIEKPTLENLFTIKYAPNGKAIIPFNEISKFQGANTNSTRNEEDKIIIDTMEQKEESADKTSNTTGSQLGSSKSTSLAVLIKDKENNSRAFNVAAISSTLTPTQDDGIFKIKQANPILNFLNEFMNLQIGSPNVNPNIVKLVDHIKSFLTHNPISGEYSVNLLETDSPSNINQKTNKLINNISDDIFNRCTSSLLENAFKDDDPYNGFTPPVTTDKSKISSKKWMVYQLTTGTNLYVGATGMKVYNTQFMDAKNAKSMLKSDIQNTIDNNVVLYDVANQYNKIATKNIMLNIMMNENKDYIIDTLNNSKIIKSNSSGSDLWDKVYAKLVGDINNQINPDIKEALNNIPGLVDEFKNPMNSYDFFLDHNPSQYNRLELMNNVDYQRPSLTGYYNIYAQFINKLEKIISIKGIK